MHAEPKLIWFIASSVAFALSWASIWLLLRRFANRFIDVPNERSSHSLPTPRGGGIAFVLAFFVTAGLVSLVAPSRSAQAVGPILCILVPLWLVGAVDDARGVPAGIRYLVQLACAALAVHFFGAFPGVDAICQGIGAPWLSPISSVIAVTALVNFYNFMDGLDGIVGGCCAVQLGFFALALQQPIWWLMVGALLGFLMWNWPPAKIFMGDSGSTVLGAAVAVALLRTPDARTMWWAGLVTAPLLGDALFTLVRRLLRRENIFKAHKSHIYQRLNQSGWSHGRVAATYVVLTVAAAAVVLICN